MRSPGTKCSSRWDGCIQERLGKNGYVRVFFFFHFCVDARHTLDRNKTV